MFEEKNNHICRSLKKYKIQGSTMLVNDGTRWYPLKLKKIQQKLAKKQGQASFGSKSNRKFTDSDSNPSLDGTRLMAL